MIAGLSNDDLAAKVLTIEQVEKDTPGLALKMGKLVRANAYHYVAVPYFKRAVANKANAPACKDEDLRLAVVAGLGLPLDDESVKKAVLDAFNEGYTVDNTCTFLVGKKVLSPTQAGKCNKK